MRVSIIIVTWNALPLLKQCLPSVVATSYSDFEVIIADNASEDETAAWVREHYPQVKVVTHEENWAFCRGNNAAVPHATGDIIIFLNNDVEVPQDWLGPIVDAFARDERLGAAQPKLLQYTDRKRFEYAGASGGYIDRYGYPFTRGRLFFTMEKDAGQYDSTTEIFWASGAAMAVRRRVLDEVGLFDEQFELHMEEIDLCWRIRRAGYFVRAIPQSRAYHIGGGSLPQGDTRKVYYNFRNGLLLLFKNLPRREWPRIFPVRAALDAVAAARALLAGRPGEAAAILRALRDAHQMKAAYADQRHDEGPLPSYNGCIVWDYFVRGRKRFSDLPRRRFSDLA